MIFKSAELRWFFRDSTLPYNSFNNSFPHIQPSNEKARTDLYLLSKLAHTGIKIMQGKHELKLRSGLEKTYKNFPLQSWTKWSYRDEKSIVDMIRPSHLEEWISIEKIRWIKKVSFTRHNELVPAPNHRVEKEGCNIEYTEIHIKNQQKIFSYGLEAFSKDNTETEVLKIIIDKLENALHPLKNIPPASYPELLIELTKP